MRSRGHSSPAHRGDAAAARAPHSAASNHGTYDGDDDAADDVDDADDDDGTQGSADATLAKKMCSKYRDI